MPSVITCNCKQHITCPGHRRDHGPPLTPLSCKQSATDKHFTRNPLSSQQPQSAPVCAMSSSPSSVYCFIANNTSADLIMMSPSHVTHARTHREDNIMSENLERVEMISTSDRMRGSVRGSLSDRKCEIKVTSKLPRGLSDQIEYKY